DFSRALERLIGNQIGAGIDRWGFGLSAIVTAALADHHTHLVQATQLGITPEQGEHQVKRRETSWEHASFSPSFHVPFRLLSGDLKTRTMPCFYWTNKQSCAIPPASWSRRGGRPLIKSRSPSSSSPSKRIKT